ncbi:hypothetical protein M3Y97_00718800 [Aphelenchoides bicaudatus]|nr:hypothetical protein M3Y97_00718800 [Aphelenchoides bicaudatus]
MDGSTALQDGASGMPNGQFIPNGPMMSSPYNGMQPPVNFYNGPQMMPSNMQHRPDMPSTSNGLPPIQFPHQQPSQSFPSPMDAPNGNFYANGAMPPQPGMMFNGAPQYFNGHPQMPPMGAMPTTPSANGYPPEYPSMPHRVPSAPGNQARASPFAQAPMNGPMTPTYGMPGQAKTPGMFMPAVPGRSTPGTSMGFVFTSDMANQATCDVAQGKNQSIAQWHSQNQASAVATNQSSGRKSVGGARNSPSYSTTAATGRKRKGSQAQERQNPTPSPQLANQPGSVPEFKQPMSNHAPGSVPDSSMTQFAMDQKIKTEQGMQIKNDPNMDHNPLKQMEMMAKQSENAGMAPKLADQFADSKQSTDSLKAAKLARLDQIRKKIITDDPPPQAQYPPQMYANMPPQMRFMPNAPYPMPPNGQPPMYYSGPNGMPQNGQMYPNGMPPTTSMDMSGQMTPNGHQLPPGYMQRFPQPGMMPQPPNGMPGTPNGMRMPYPPMDMNMPRPNCPPEMFNNQWHESMPQPLANLDSRIPSQKINYYGNSGNGQPQSMPQTSIPPQSLKNGT